MTKSVFTKDPDAKLDYSWDWTRWLTDGDFVTGAEISAPAGITLGTTLFDDHRVTVWVSGGSADQSYPLTCKITTDMGRIDERTLTIRILDR